MSFGSMRFASVVASIALALAIALGLSPVSPQLAVGDAVAAGPSEVAPPVDAVSSDHEDGATSGYGVQTAASISIVAQTTTVAGVALCTDHSPTVWHGLVKRNSDGSINCTYTHTHMDNPHNLDKVLGSLPSYLGGEISYPWETFNSTTGVLENVAKHRVYDWETIVGASCITSNASWSFDNFRIEVHADGNMGATTRFHSYWLQARTCDPNNPSYHGTISLGGWMDTGILSLLTSTNPYTYTYVPLPGDPSTGAQSSNQRIHGSPQAARSDFTWYGSSGAVQTGAPAVAVTIGTRKEDWGPVDPTNPSGPTLFYGGTQNGSYIEPGHLLTIMIPAWFPGNVNGFVNYSGYTDRYGNVVPTCDPVLQAPDCVPITLKNVKVGSYQFRNDAHGIGTREYDVQVNGQSLIQWPN